MTTKEYINTLFEEYEDSEALIDFKEELLSNLDARIKSLCDKGMVYEEAFHKTTEELGDISILAHEISLKKRKEIFETMYMQKRNYMDTKRVGAYILLGMVVAFGAIVAGMLWFSSENITQVLGVLLVFGVVPATGYIYLGLTQETASRNPMSKKRALLYSGAAFVFLFGITVFLMSYFGQNTELNVAIATLIPFIIPSVAFGAFLVLTEQNYHKPWVRKQHEEMMKAQQNRFSSPAAETRYGLLVGALWILATAVFIVLSITIGIKFSWLAFVGAIVIQLVIEAMISVKHH